MTELRMLRESKNQSQDAAAAAAGLTYSQYVRIEEGSGKTTPEEIAAAMKAVGKLKVNKGRKIVGRPFSDPVKRAALEAARAGQEDLIGDVKPPKRASRSRKAQ